MSRAWVRVSGRQVDGWEELEENTIQEGRMKND